MSYQSILELFLHNVDVRGNAAAAQVKRGGRYEDVTWRAINEEARAIGAGLVALGLLPGDRACLISNTRLEWVNVDLGILWAGAVTVPIYPSNLSDECQYIAENSDSVLVFAEDEAQVEKFRSERSRLRGVKNVIQMTGKVSGDEWVLSIDKLKELGKPVVGELDARRASLTPDSVLTLIYTSGTTGRPKGVVTLHRAMLYEAEVVAKEGVIEPGEIQLLFLPLAHSFAKMLEIAWFGTGHIMAFAESLTTLKENLAEVRPTLMCGVPRVYEKFHQAVLQKASAAGGVKVKLFDRACELSEKNGEAELRGERLPLPQWVQFEVLKRVVFKKVGAGLMQILGGRMRLMCSGGAPLSRRINWFFRDAGFTILEGYGLTETAAGTFINPPGQNRIGTVGQPLPGTKVKIAADGEILIQGPGVMREYWKRPEDTAAVMQDGWFHTGDVGEIDEDGCLRITDRKKDIIVTAGGKNVAPQNIENLFKTHRLISQVVVHGDQRSFLSALITLDADALRELTQSPAGAYADLTQRPEVYRAVQGVVDNFNRQLASYETVKKFKLLEHDFSQESGELTPTLKIKRRVINDRYRQVFDGFYADSYVQAAPRQAAS